MASKTSLIVAAIDFGTTYSGWAFSFKNEYYADPTKVSCKQWNGDRIVSPKAPTAVLIKPDRKTLDSFGYDAETKYADLASDDSSEYQRWYFFRRFKIMLHEKMNFDRNITLEDETKKSLPAKTVFSLAIRYLKEDMLKTSRDRLGSGHIMEDEITWVLTVPPIWNDAAKQFMKEAAVQAGICSENLKIALESESASIFCRHLPVEKIVEGGEKWNFQTGSKYMVLDAGGGTVDITVHKVMPTGKLKEIHKASGGAWGGTQVDEACKQFIISLIGKTVFCRFETECIADYLDIFREFEIKKRNITPENNDKITFRLPCTLKDIFEEETGEDLHTAIQQTSFANKIVLSGGKLQVEGSLMKHLFSGSIQNIVCHVKEMMKDREVRRISSILMVGGFSESKMLQHAIRSSFPNVKVIIPQEAGLVVLKGAVVFGHSPSFITQRVCKYTYGVDVSLPFDNKIHDPMKRSEYADGPRCDGIFDKYVEIGQSIALNEITEEKSYSPLEENQRSLIFKIFASTKKSPMYVTDEGCVKLGYVEVDILDMSVPRKERQYLLSLKLGGTEFDVQVREKRTGKIAKTTTNFLG
ncbi:hypothetical protein CHS0354_003148 [Potamilus streckersoni]|uniref:Heat shock 70 kDa protein 12A n=1 Tax=Potamilus streckersoni TaxID=2493646 RepID=A0AAE0RP37_9BIVA|nr:hypothetical protein CHS0354_003148 [Potamilus streckersoni]